MFLFAIHPILVEVIGYAASAFVLISFLFKNIKVVRIINVIGALFFVFYGLFTKTYPTMFMNLALIIVHCIYLYSLIKNEKKNIDAEKEN
jgi:uncharacterized protein with PQ loop repeat